MPTDVDLDGPLLNGPVPRAQLDVLLRLARAVHQHRADLLRAARMHALRRPNDRRTWIHYVDVIASTFADPDVIGYVERASDVIGIIGRIAGSGVVTTSEPEVVQVVERIRSTIEKDIDDDVDPLGYLAQANAQAHAIVAGWLHTHEVPNALPDTPARLRVVYAAPTVPEPPVASSDIGAGGIVWTFSPVENALWGAIQPAAILKHEYLSHFAPRHRRLSAAVREGWLMDVLLDELQGDDSATRSFDVGVFTYLLSKIVEPLARHSRPGARDLPYRIRRSNPEFYWQMTRAIVGLRADDIDRADRVDELLDALTALSRDELETVLDGATWPGIAEMAVIARAIGPFP